MKSFSLTVFYDKVKKFIYRMMMVGMCFICGSAYGQKAQADAAIKQAKTTASGASGAFKAYQKFVDNDSVHWLYGGDASLSFAATSLINWLIGGEDQIGIRPTVNLFANYKKGKRTFENYAVLAYGILKTGERKAVKNDDRLHYTAKLGHQISPRWAYTGALLVRTQFAPGYTYAGENITSKVSDFLAPINLYLSVGIDYMPNKNISCMLSPMMGRATFVRSDSSTVIIASGMMTKETDAQGQQIQVPHHSRYEFGGGALIRLNGNLFQNKVTYNSQLELFSNYLEDPQNMEVLWMFETKILLYKNITANWHLDVKYDDNQKTRDVTTGNLRGAKLQAKYITGIGLSYRF